MSILRLRIEGPLQSWGTYSRFTERDTAREPSKSGVIGLLCSALGRPRTADVSDLAALRMAVRVEREGFLANDFHTVQNVPKASGATPDTVVSNRYYLADGCFQVFLEGDNDLLLEISNALSKPRWALFLGRKSFIPSAPILVERRLQTGALNDVVRISEWLGRTHERENDNDRLRTVLECGRGEGEPRLDVPVSFSERKFTMRYVKQGWVDNPCPRGK